VRMSTRVQDRQLAAKRPKCSANDGRS